MQLTTEARRRPDRAQSHRPGQAGHQVHHVATTGDSVPVACAVTAANVNDTLPFERLFPAAFAVTARIRTGFADKDYDAEHHRKLCRRFGTEPHIHKHGLPHGSGLDKQRCPVERSFTSERSSTPSPHPASMMKLKSDASSAVTPGISILKSATPSPVPSPSSMPVTNRCWPAAPVEAPPGMNWKGWNPGMLTSPSP